MLIDEIDLHLHPLWQLEIMKDLSSLFPATQFIATSHSPLIVQAADTANLVLLQKLGDSVEIVNDVNVPRTYRVDQILTSLLFKVKRSRNEATQQLFDQRALLIDKGTLTEEEETLLRDINREIDKLPTAQDEFAIDLMRRIETHLDNT